MKLAILSATLSAACAFTTPSSSSSTTTSTTMRRMSDVETEAPEAPAPPAVTPINGWVPDSSKPCYGLPGATAPFGFFDPLGFTKDMELSGVKRFREAEIMHGRVAMMATVGYLIAENTPTIAYGFNTPTIANNQIPEISPFVMFPFFLTINLCEAYRANKGWKEPTSTDVLFTLRDDYYPGDLGFDPLGLKPTSKAEFDNMQAKELSNGRLAMIAAAGMCVQELATNAPLLG